MCCCGLTLMVAWRPSADCGTRGLWERDCSRCCCSFSSHVAPSSPYAVDAPCSSRCCRSSSFCYLRFEMLLFSHHTPACPQSCYSYSTSFSFFSRHSNLLLLFFSALFPSLSYSSSFSSLTSSLISPLLMLLLLQQLPTRPL